MTDQRFPKAMRLLSRGDFRRVYDTHVAVSDSMVRLTGVLSEHEYPRMGLSVARRHGGAVVRNRWKRLVREAFRLSRDKLPRGLDFVVIPRDGAKPELGELQKSLVNLSWRLVKRLRSQDKDRQARNERKRGAGQDDD